MPRSAPTRRSKGGRGGNFGRILLGMLLGVALTAVALLLYFRYGRPPVAVTDTSSLWEPLVENVPLNARAEAEAKTPPFPAGEDAFEGGAHTYRTQCAQCHGTPGHDSTLGRSMLPRAPQFFSRDRKSTGAQSPGELYWKTAFGIRRSGMPAYNKQLTDTQLWQLALLLHSAADELPDPVHNILTASNPAQQPTEIKP